MSKSPAPRLKLVIRRLPPTLPEDVFWRVLGPYVDDKSVWRRYVQGRVGDNFGTVPILSRAYVLMKDVDALVALHSGFDGHLFRSRTGEEYQAVVEYAPIEKTPYKSKNKVDQRAGSIEEDPDYKSFLESLAVTEPKATLETSTPVSQPTTTPLLEALRAQQAKSKKSKKDKDKGKDKDKDGKDGKKKAAALASISEAASKRAPKDKANVVMVAGKGRDVFVGPADEAVAAEKKKKSRPKKKKDEDKDKDKADKPKEEKKEEKKKERKPREKKPAEEKDKPKADGDSKDRPNEGDDAAPESKRSRGRGRKGRGGGGGGGGGDAEGRDAKSGPSRPAQERPIALATREKRPTEARIDQ